MYIDKKDRTHNNILYRKLYRIWWHIKERCYNPRDKSYKNYGALGVTLSDRWEDLDNFLYDVDSLEGYCTEGILNSTIELDKDTKYKGNKLYSKDTCKFIPSSANKKYRPNIMPAFIIMDNKGNTYEGFNKSKASKDTGVGSETLHNLLTLKLEKSKKGFQARYLKDLESHPFIPVDKLYPHIMVYTPAKRLLEFNSVIDTSDSIPDLTKQELWKYLSGDTSTRIGVSVKAYQIYWKDEFKESYLVEPRSIRAYRAKYRRILVTEPDGITSCIYNIELFAKAHNMSVKAVKARLEPKYLEKHQGVHGKLELKPIYIEPEY